MSSFGNAQLIPGQSFETTTTTTTSDPSGRPINGNVLRDEVVTQQTLTTEPSLFQTSTLPTQSFTDLNRNGVPDQLERGFTDLNRNGIPDQLEGRTFTQTPTFVDVREAPVIVEQITKPTIVHEVLKTEEVVEIQPVIEREREQLDVYEVVQPMREREVVATEVRTAVLPAQTRAAVIEDQSAFLAQRSVPAEFSTREVAPTMHQTVQNAPIIHETVVHKVIEEVQPVIYKEIDRPVLIKETLPIAERVIEAPVAHHTTLPMRDLGVRTTGGYATQSFTTTQVGGYSDLNGNGIPDSMERGSYGRSFNDLNGNGIPDNLERQGFVGQTGFTDLNRNGVPDQLERQGSYGSSTTGFTDLNRNGVPDQLERTSYTTGAPSMTYAAGPTLARTSSFERTNAAYTQQPYASTGYVQTGNLMQPAMGGSRIPEFHLLAVEARGLVSSDPNMGLRGAYSSLSDPFVVVKLKGLSHIFKNEKQNSPVVMNNNNPVWNWEFMLHPTKTTDVIDLRVYDQDRANRDSMLSRNKYLGKALIPAAQFFNRGPTEMWMPLYGKGKLRIPGEIRVVIDYGTASRRIDTHRFESINQQYSQGATVLPTQGFSQQYPQGAQYSTLPQQGFVQQPLAQQGLTQQYPQGAQQRTLSDLNGNGIPDRMEKAHGLRDLNGNGIDDSVERKMQNTSLNSQTY